MSRIRHITVLPILLAGLLVFTAVPPDRAEASIGAGRVRLLVEGMYTASCPILVEKAARTIGGVRDVDASLESHSAVVEFDAARTTIDEIRRVIREKAGFKTRLP